MAGQNRDLSAARLKLLSLVAFLDSSPAHPICIPSLVASSAVEFYQPRSSIPVSSPPTLSSNSGPWAALPPEWKSFFCHVANSPHSDQLLRSLAQAQPLPSFPASLSEFLINIKNLALPRSSHAHEKTIYSTFIGDTNFEDHASIDSEAEQVFLKSDQDRLGMSDKKAHEVEYLGRLVASLATDPKTGRRRPIIDLGAGQGHLSRSLATAGFEVIAIDQADGQSTGGARLADLLARFSTHGLVGSVRFKTATLDRPALQGLLGGLEDRCVVAGLHACGDLTPAILDAFIAPDLPEHALALVGCCYNLCTPAGSRFPTSTVSAPPELFSLAHRRLAAQAPDTWATSPQNWARAQLAITKLAFRALWQAEAGSTAPVPKLGRLPDRCYTDYACFHAAACKKANLSGTPSVASVPEGDLFKLGAAWTLRALLGPCIESAIILDRYIALCERLPRSRPAIVSLVNLFDQAGSRSLRNIAIVIRPLSDHSA